MEFTSPWNNKISVNHKSMEKGYENISETKDTILSVYEELVEANDALLAELSGDVKKRFAGAKDTTEMRLKNVTNTLGAMSDLLKNYTEDNKKINMNAAILAGSEVWKTNTNVHLSGNTNSKITYVEDYVNKLIKGGKAFIPQKVDNATVLDAYDLMRGMNLISEKTIQENSTANKIELMKPQYIPLQGEYIENQNAWKNVKFGNSTNSNIQYSGCGIIATYNALSALGNAHSADMMMSVISAYERDGAAANGEFGVAPRAIASYFAQKGYRVQTTESTDSWMLNQFGENNDVAIVTVYNDQTDITQMLHTVCITKTENGGYIAHNINRVKNGKSVPSDEKTTLEEAIKSIGRDSVAISVIGIKEPLIGDFPEKVDNYEA